VVFSEEQDLRRHFATEHGSEMNMSRAQRRQVGEGVYSGLEDVRGWLEWGNMQVIASKGGCSECAAGLGLGKEASGARAVIKLVVECTRDGGGCQCTLGEGW
jgi:hypothetical protein